MLKRYLPTKWVGGKTIGTADVMNNIEEGINNVNDDICESSTSGDLLNENVNSFKVGTGSINGENKDFTNQMEQSVITLDNIQGKTVKINNELVSSNLSRIYSSNIPIINDFEVESDGYYLSWATNELVARENYYVTKKVPVEPNTDYIFSFINNNICFYDIDGNFIKVDTVPGREIKTNTGLGNSTFIYTTPPNAYWVKISAFKNAVQPPRITKFIDYIDYDIELRSLPNGVCDEIKDGNLIQRVGHIKLDGDEGWKYGGESAGCVQFYLDSYLKGHKPIRDTECWETGGHFTQYWIKKTASDGETYAGECIRIFDAGHIYIKINSGDLNAFLTSLKNHPVEIIYELSRPIIIPINLSIVANPNDVINIDTPVPLTCTHKVSLNTKSQIEELQEVVQKEKRSVWQKIKELTDVKISLGNIGYIKLPKLLGGLILQWGGIGTAFDNGIVRYSVTFPISYPNTVTGVFVNCNNVGGGNVFDVIVNSSDIGKTGFAVTAKHMYGGNWSTEFKWIAIGY